MTRGRFVCHIYHFTARFTIILPNPNTQLNLSYQLISLIYRYFSQIPVFGVLAKQIRHSFIGSSGF
ncbi:hypothetical protein [Acetobacterium wieringae]|uniref:hypothetical protein n=1 Tax=Acetobacterium wieringae TaxID=52694 RepID=UPI0026F1E6A6|nr:hypothetical protein [Acetobacterium wieringae]